MTEYDEKHQPGTSQGAVNRKAGSGGTRGQRSHPSASDAQREAEEVLVKDTETQLQEELRNPGIHLEREFAPKGVDARIDGYCHEPPIMCEVWAHQGKPKGSQYSKVMADALKMLFVERDQDRDFRKILVFAHEDARRPFQDGKSWRAECLKLFGVRCEIGCLPPHLRTRVTNAQVSQGNAMRGSD